MSQELKVAAPPPKPLMVFDGDCNFCRRWIARWHNLTGDAVEYVPCQDDSIPARFPEIPREKFAQAVHLIRPDGTFCTGAEAVFRSLHDAGRERWLYRLYHNYPGFADLAELLYEEVAAHRVFLSKLDRIYCGPGTEPPSYIRTRFIFLRGLALIYLVAFWSLLSQIQGLAGSDGIVPAAEHFQRLKAEAAQLHLGISRFYLDPSVAWWNASDASLHWQCRLGVALSVLLLFGIAPAPVLFLLWAIYLSLTSICSPFLDFQWDLLLLETGFLAIFFAPWQWIERPSRQAQPSALMLWLLRWLLFRLMLESGCVKLLSGDISWWNLTALRYHYETQPLPTWIGWHVWQWPLACQKFCTFMVLSIEVVLPALIFAGRKARLTAAGVFVFLQLLILLTGNYGFFNWLTILLCVPLLDDGFLTSPRLVNQTPAPRGGRWPRWVIFPLAYMIAAVTSLGLFVSVGMRPEYSKSIVRLYAWLQPLRSFNNYGLFAVMTETRPEIIVEGSNDGQNWQPYEFKDKPGRLDKKPSFVAPYQPRLDWQMWFAALETPQQNPWFVRFLVCLLQNSPDALSLLEKNPFPHAPPRYIRAQLYEYHFTSLAERRLTGDWWTRRFLGPYVPPVSLAEK